MAKFNKKKLPSRHTSLGPEKAPQRSFYYAMKLTEKDVVRHPITKKIIKLFERIEKTDSLNGQ